jgi:predicted O-methyltransferase YrrM
MKKLRSRLLALIDLMAAPFVYPSAWLLKNIRRVGVRKLPHCRNALMKVGVFPIRDHYYEPQFNYRKNRQPFSQDRELSAIDWNVDGQLKMISSLSFTHELQGLSRKEMSVPDFHLDTILFGPGDAEYWYQLIRLMKPGRIFEIGGGNSTLVAIKAIRKNLQEDPDYSCKHICIEPYERPWLESTGVSMIRKKVEDLGVEFFSELQENDVLFIDSSHVIRPQGDVVFEYLELLPILKVGVIVHIHDIFSPRNYLREMLVDKAVFWNEQYLLEAFLSQNDKWKITGALNYLHHNHYEELKSVAPFLTPDREPSSFYIQRIA